MYVVDNCCSLPAPPTGHRKTTTIGPTRAQVHQRQTLQPQNDFEEREASASLGIMSPPKCPMACPAATDLPKHVPFEPWSPPSMMQDFHRDTYYNRKKTALFCSIATRSFGSISMTKIISPPGLMTDLQYSQKRPHIYSAGCAELAVYS